MGCVYLATNIINGKCYIGKTVGPLWKRMNSHMKDNSKKSFFHKAICKHGAQSFTWKELYNSDDEKTLFNEEIKLIALMNTMHPNGYNLAKGGQGSSGLHPSPETRIKLHNAQLGNTKGRAGKGKKMPDTTKEALRLVNSGRRHTTEAKAKMSISRMGHFTSETTKRKISLANKGKRKPDGALARSWETRRLHATTGRLETQ